MWKKLRFTIRGAQKCNECIEKSGALLRGISSGSNVIWAPAMSLCLSGRISGRISRHGPAASLARRVPRGQAGSFGFTIAESAHRQ